MVERFLLLASSIKSTMCQPYPTAMLLATEMNQTFPPICTMVLPAMVLLASHQSRLLSSNRLGPMMTLDDSGWMTNRRGRVGRTKPRREEEKNYGRKSAGTERLGMAGSRGPFFKRASRHRMS